MGTSLLFYAFLTLVVIGSIFLRDYKRKKRFDESLYKHISGKTYKETFYDSGNYGEYLIFRKLEEMGEKFILTNIYLQQKDNTLTEIDLLAVNSTGIYVFESKNYSGWIFGDEKDKMWTQSLKGGNKYKFYNPIWQNNGHISALDYYLSNEYTDAFFSFIIFSERCELKKVSYTSPNILIIKRNILVNEFKNQILSRSNRLSTKQVQEIYSKIKLKSLANEEVKKRHIEEIKTKHHN